MDIRAAITLGDDEARALATQLRAAQQAEPDLTADLLAERLLRKLFRKWADDARADFIQRSQPTMQALIAELAVDPDRNEKLRAIGVEFTAGGELRRIEG